MSMQLEFLDSPASPTTLNDIIPGNCARMRHSGKILMRLKITGFMLNSNIVADVLNRGDVFVVDMAKGTCYATNGTCECTSLAVKLQYSIKEVE